MSKVIQAKYKASRRLGVSIWGDSKDPFNKKNYRPGQHGPNSQVKLSDFGLHLRAKQRIKLHYGRVREKQFRNIFARADKMKGNTAENFVGLLERRLDAIVYRLNIAPSIFAARQIVGHGHIQVNGKKVNIPSYVVKEGDVIEVREKSKQLPMIIESAQTMERRLPDYLEFDPKALSGKFIRTPSVSEVPFPFEPEVNLIVEYYSH